MAIAPVGTASTASQGASGAAVTPAWGANQPRTVGNLLICNVTVTGVATLPTTPSGWSIKGQVAGTSCSATVYYKVAAGGDAAPTINAITSGVIAALCQEYRGADLTPADQSGTAVGTTSPITATAGGADAAVGDLLIATGADFRSVARSPNDTWSSNHVTAPTNTGSNNGVSSVNHYSFCYGLTNSNSGADTAVMTISTTTSLTGAAVAFATFKAAAFSGTGAVAEPAADAGTGSEIFSGSGGVAEPSANAGTGGETFSGTGAVAEPSANAGAGSQVFSGTGAVASAASANAGAGSMTTGFTGAGDVAVASANAGTGTETFAGSGAVATVSASAGTGAEVFAGAGAVAEPSASSGTGAVTLTFTGTGAVAAASAITGTGSETFAGSGAVAATSASAGSGMTAAFVGTGAVAIASASTGSGSVSSVSSQQNPGGPMPGMARVTGRREGLAFIVPPSIAGAGQARFLCAIAGAGTVNDDELAIRLLMEVA